MTTKKNNYTEYWSTPIAEYINDNQEDRDYAKSLLTTPAINEDFCGLSGGKFLDWICDSARDYVSKFYHKDFDIELTRTWISVQNPLENFPTHSHTVDVIGVYYINSNDNHPPLTIYDPRPAHKFNEVSIQRNGVTIIDCARHINIKSETGKLVFFPGYLMHGVDANLTREPRAALAMNFQISNK